MAVITEARLVGDWRRIVGDHVVSYANVGELDDVGVTGTVTLTPNFGKGPQGVLADDASLYTAHEIKCRVIWGRLHDNDLNNPWQDLIVAVDGKPIVWTAAFSLTYKWRSDVQAQKIALPQVTFDSSAITAGEISLTSLIPSAQIPSNYEPYLVSAQASAQVASDAKTVAELSAVAADQAKADATLAKTAAETAKTDAETAAALATTEADRAVGLATAQDQAVADTVTAGGPTTTALNATYGSKDELRAHGWLASDFGVVGDGTVDDGIALQDFMDATAAAGVAALLEPNSTLSIRRRIYPPTGLNLNLQGSTLRNDMIGSPNDAMLWIRDAQNVAISNGTLDGNAAGYSATTEHRHGISILGSENVALTNLLCIDNKGDGLYLGIGTTGNAPKNVTLDRVLCLGNHRQGLSIVSVDGFVATASLFNDTTGTAPQAGVDIEPNNGETICRNIRFVACDMRGNAGAGVLVSMWPAATAPQHGIELVGCDMTDSRWGIHGELYTDVTVIGGRISGNTEEGVRVYSDRTGERRRLRLTNVSIRDNGGQGLRVLAPFQGINLLGCDVRDNVGIGADFLPTGPSSRLSIISTFSGNSQAGGTQTHGMRTSAQVSKVTLIGPEFVNNTSATASLGDEAASRTHFSGASRLWFSGQTTGTSAPAGGAAGAMPANPAGYMDVSINGTTRRIPYF